MRVSLVALVVIACSSCFMVKAWNVGAPPPFLWTVTRRTTRASRTTTVIVHAVPVDNKAILEANNTEMFAHKHYASILDDGNGHIRGDLASSIWNWDHEHRMQEPDKAHDMPKFKYSTRKGLRLVDEIARDLLDSLSTKSFSSTSSSSDGVTEDSSAMSYSDLVQEGVVALMYAMANFDPSLGHTFEQYATKAIYNNMSRLLADDSRPIRLPSHVHALLRNAKKERAKLFGELGHEPTTAQVAERVGMDAEKLDFYQLVSRGTLSVESTIEVRDPLLEEKPVFTDEEKYESEYNIAKDDNPLVERGDDLYYDEGEDEMWVHQEQIAAPLKDAIPDTLNPTPEEFTAEEMIHENVDDFLVKTLTPRELELIRMRYGLGQDESADGKGLSFSAIAKHLNISRTRAQQIEEQALEKLRTSFANRYVETYLDDDHETIEESV